jgi:hypothetical protein
MVWVGRGGGVAQWHRPLHFRAVIPQQFLVEGAILVTMAEVSRLPLGPPHTRQRGWLLGSGCEGVRTLLCSPLLALLLSAAPFFLYRGR